MAVRDALPEDLGVRIYMLAEASGLSLRQIAEMSGVGRSTVHGWCSGKSLPQSDDQLIDVVRVCLAAADRRADGQGQQRVRAASRNEREWRGLLAAAKQVRDSRSLLAPQLSVSEQPTLQDPARPAVRRMPVRNPCFTGRDTVLEQIHYSLCTDASGTVRVVPLHGIGGVGKTQLAIEYAHLHADEYQLVWWVSAQTIALAARDLLELATALGLSIDGPIEVVLPRLWAALANRDDWLLIYDNVDDVAVVAQFRPPESGRLLVTSRAPMVGRLGTIVEVAEFDRGEAVQLLVNRCPAITVDEADQVAAALGDLPLAVEQAGCFLSETPSLDVSDYLQLLAAQPAQAGLADPTVDRHPGLVAVVEASRAQLDSICPPAAALLDQMAFLAPDPLPIVPLREPSHDGDIGVRVGDVATTTKIIRDITSLGLVRHTSSGVQMHRLVQALLRTRLDTVNQTRARHTTRQLLATAHPASTRPDEPAIWPVYATLLPHVLALLEHSASEDCAQVDPDQYRALAIDTTRYLYVSAQYSTGRNLAQRIHTRWTETLGPDHPDTLRSANRLVAALSGLGEYKAAQDLADETWRRLQRVLGEDHPDTLSAANNLAIELSNLGGFAAAEDLFRDTWQRQLRVLGNDHPRTLRSANNLAENLTRLGEFAAARDLHRDTWRRQLRVLGEDHPDTVRSANNLHVLGEH
jgi:transcriptional regulator with XRE-family HTH domain